MRDLFVTMVVFGTLPFILKRPYIGILLWAWLGYMNPHRLCWGFAFGFPFAQLTALFTLTGLLLHFKEEPRKIPWDRTTIILAIFLVWMFVTTWFAVYADPAWNQMIKVYKIQFMTFMSLILINNRYRVHLLVWIITLSLGFYGIKGGIFTLTTGGGYHVRGPLGTFIGGNNEIGLALLMTLPLMRYLQLHSSQWWLRLGLGGAMFFTVMAILGTQSRGALVGLAVMGMYFFIKSRKKFWIILIFALAAPPVWQFMPESWHSRMQTIETYEEDQSMQERLGAWAYAMRVAQENPLTGGGFEVFLGRTDAHSIYFEILGEQGYIGLSLFLLLLISAWHSSRKTSLMIKKRRLRKEVRWAEDLSRMLQVSLVGYATSGAALGLAYFDLFYQLVALTAIIRVVALKEMDRIEVEQKDTKALSQKPVRKFATPSLEGAARL